MITKLRSVLMIAAFCLAAPFASAADKPLKVFILAGQSNMQGTAHIKTFPHLAESPETKALAARLVDGDGNFRSFDQVRIAAFSGGRGGATKKSGPLTKGFGSSLDKDCLLYTSPSPRDS